MTGNAYYFFNLLQVSGNPSKSDFILLFFHDFINIYNPEAGKDNPGWHNPVSNRLNYFF